MPLPLQCVVTVLNHVTNLTSKPIWAQPLMMSIVTFGRWGYPVSIKEVWLPRPWPFWSDITDGADCLATSQEQGILHGANPKALHVPFLPIAKSSSWVALQMY